jgi:hypothetical protein
MKMGVFDLGIAFIVFCLLRKISGEITLEFDFTRSFALGMVLACQSLRAERN